MSKAIIEQYTYASLVNEAMTRKCHPNCRDNSARGGSFSFTQTHSIEEAEDFAIHGWDLGLKQYKIEDGVLVNGKTELQTSVAGYFPHIQNHIVGYPQDMYQLYDSREYNLPTLDIVANLSYNAGVDSSKALEFGKSLVSYINLMASKRNIRLTGVFATNQKDGKKVVQVITLKDFDSALVINNIAFAFHPSFFRRLWFSILEGKEYWASGYGQSIPDYKKYVEGELTGGKSDETLYFKNLENIYKFDWDDKDLDKVTF